MAENVVYRSVCPQPAANRWAADCDVHHEADRFVSPHRPSLCFEFTAKERTDEDDAKEPSYDVEPLFLR